MKKTLIGFVLSLLSIVAITSCGEVQPSTSLSTTTNTDQPTTVTSQVTITEGPSVTTVTSEQTTTVTTEITTTQDIHTGPIILIGFPELEQRVVVEDGFVYIPTPDKDGYQFIGWFHDEGFTNEFDPYAPLQENTTLYPKFMNREFTEIKTKEDFFAMKADGNYVLTCDLDLGGSTVTPLGTFENPFTGEFDGRNFMVRNFKVNSDEFYSLFGVITGKVINLKVNNNFSVETNKSLMVAGVVSVVQEGLVKNCFTSGRIIVSGLTSSSTVYAAGVVARNDRGIVRMCGSEMSISNNNEGVAISGGVIAYNGGSISYRKSIVELCMGKSSSIQSTTNNTRTAAYAGGVVGFNFGIVDKCLSHSQTIFAQCTEYQCFAAGVVADNNGGKLTNLFSASNISVSTEKGNTFRGSVIARNFEATTETENGTYENIYGFVGQNISYEVPSKYEASSNHYQIAVPLISSSDAGNIEWYKEVLGITEFKVKEGNFPTYNSEYKEVPTTFEEGLPGNPISIKTATDLLKMDANKSYKLDADIDLNGVEITPIGTYTRPFAGLFDGNSHKITNLNITKTNGYNALFGCINGGVINLTIEGSVKFENTAKVPQFTGILSAMAIRSYFANTTVKGNLDTTCYGNSVGGLAGYAEYCEFKRCNFEGSIKHTSTNRTNFAGGIAGNTFSCEIDECYSKATIESSGKIAGAAGALIGKMLYGVVHNSIADATFTLDVVPSLYIGGAVGHNFKGQITNIYAKLSVHDPLDALVGGVCGYNEDLIANCVYSALEEYYSCGASANVTDTRKEKDLNQAQMLAYLGTAFSYDGANLVLAYTLGGK